MLVYDYNFSIFECLITNIINKVRLQSLYMVAKMRSFPLDIDPPKRIHSSNSIQTKKHPNQPHPPIAINISKKMGFNRQRQDLWKLDSLVNDFTQTLNWEQINDN
jgi:hypothetical protein